MSIKTSILRFKFDYIRSFLLHSEPGGKVFAEKIADGHGNFWNLWIRRGRNPDNGEGEREDPYFGMFLQNLGPDDVFAKHAIILRDALGKVYYEKSFRLHCFEKGRSRGSDKIIKRSKILDAKNNILADWALHVDVQLQLKPEEESLLKPPSSLAKRMLHVLDAGGGDVSFKVGSEVVTAYKGIIHVNAPVLFDFCEDSSGGSPIPINGMTPETFRIVLRYAYAEQVPDMATISASGKEIIDAANRLGVVGLKMAVETILVESLVIDKNNAADWLVFADAKTCPLLKEYAMSFCIARARDMINSDMSERLKESPNLMGELVSEMARGSDDDDRFDDGGGTSVNDLRMRLHWKGLDLDGSKEMLVARLRRFNKRQRSE